MNPIYIHFTTFHKNTDASVYIRRTLMGLFDYFVKLGGEGIAVKEGKYAGIANFILENGFNGDPIPVTKSENFPELDEEHQRRIKDLITCAKDIIAEVSPLLSDETGAEYQETFLNEDWKGFGKGCGVISRTTNLAAVYFLFPNTMISDDGQLNREAPMFPQTENRLSSRMKSEEGALMGQAPFDSFVL